MSCEACNNLSKVWDATQQLLVSRFTHAKTGEPTMILVQGNQNPQSVTIKVNYCPWCGQKLKED